MQDCSHSNLVHALLLLYPLDLGVLLSPKAKAEEALVRLLMLPCAGPARLQVGAMMLGRWRL